jgi:alpha-glucosidase
MTATFLSLSSSGKALEMHSPDGKIRFEFQLTDSCPTYNVWYENTPLIVASKLTLVFRGSAGNSSTSALGAGLRMLDPTYRESHDQYTLPIGRNAIVDDRFNEYNIPLQEPQGRHRKITLIVRLYNDGLAFRWSFPRQANWTSFELLAENTGFRLCGDPVLLASFLPGYTTSHEGRYSRLHFSQVKSDTLMDTPVFLEFPDSLYMVITEAQLTDYAGMYLVKHDGLLKSELSPLPGAATKVKAILPHQTPWRVLFIGSRPGAFLESNLLTDLNAPPAIKDPSWIRPGKTDFHWWNGDVVPDTNFQPGINFETNQYYIDFCARNGIEYHTVIGYGGIAWYKNDGESYQPGPHSDPSVPIPGLDMKKICDYAATKGVGIRVWVHWKALWPNIDKTFTQFEKWGIKGMMVDFMDRDDQQMVNIQATILRKAALHHLHIQFHGAYKPTGLLRTWPNELTREGTLNYENDKWGNPITPDDDLNVVFTRLMAGPTDYHLGGFRAVTTADYTAHVVHPLVLATRCHMLAMYIILESYLPMVCDNPAAYEGQDGFDFIKHVPGTWDETRVPVAIPGQWAAIARRRTTDWFLGAINSNMAREATIPLGFLPPGRYEATIYRDAPDATLYPNHLTIETRIVQASDSLTAPLAAGGGLAARFRKL